MTDVSIDPVLEDYYNVRKRNPDFMAIFQRWAERSERLRQTSQSKLDLRYGTRPKSTLDLFYPDGAEGELPVHLFIHGGYWKALDKKDFSYIAEPFIKRGVAVAIVNYDLCPDVDVTHILEQMRQAIIWLWENGQQHRLSTQDIHISGHSAGGHLAAMLLATDWTQNSDTVPNDVVKSCISISGLHDLTPLLATSINEGVNLTETSAHQLSPLKHSVYASCPALATYGELEGEGFAEQASRACLHWQKSSLSADVMQVEGGHFDAVDALADEASATFSWAIRQMGR